MTPEIVLPDVKFHQSKLNFKWSKGGGEVKWHQDISFWPHINSSPCTAGTYVFDCTPEQGALGVLRGSHQGSVVDQYNDMGQWVGCLKPEDAAAIDMSKPLRIPAAHERLDPPLVDIFIPHGTRESRRKIDHAEAHVIVDEITAITKRSGMEKGDEIEFQLHEGRQRKALIESDEKAVQHNVGTQTLGTVDVANQAHT